MDKRLKIVAGIEGALFVGVLAGYLVMIAAALRDISRKLSFITVGVRAIEKQAEPLDEQIEDINRNLDRAASLVHRMRSASPGA